VPALGVPGGILTEILLTVALQEDEGVDME
jgi:hypothetical protein